MGRVSSIRGLLALSAAWFVLVANPARAQTAPAPGVALGLVITHTLPRDGYRTNDQLNYNDCANDDEIDFPLLITDPGATKLEVWAGTNCEDLASRTTAGSTHCWLVGSFAPASITQGVGIHVRDILAGRTVFASGTGSTQTLPPPGTEIAGTGAEACADPSGISVVNTLTLYFMLVDGSATIAGTDATWTAKYKLIAPPPPDQVTATPAPASLDIGFAYTTPSSDATFNGYQFYCDPAPGADAGASTACDDLAQTQTLVPGGAADSNALCGESAATGTSGIAFGLKSGVPYHVAVAAIDTFQNVGKLSPLACGIPEAAPAKGSDRILGDGSGTCNCAVPGTSPRSALPLLGFVLALLRLSQRRARRSA